MFIVIDLIDGELDMVIIQKYMKSLTKNNL